MSHVSPTTTNVVVPSQAHAASPQPRILPGTHHRARKCLNPLRHASCACCEGMDFLVDLSGSVANSRNDLHFVELNGTADPVPLLESFTVLESKLLRQPRWHVCVLDARHFGKSHEHHALREFQLETASHFHLSHAEEITVAVRNILYTRIRTVNPTASETTPGLLAAALTKLSNRLVLSWPPRDPAPSDILFLAESVASRPSRPPIHRLPDPSSENHQTGRPLILARRPPGHRDPRKGTCLHAR